MEATITKLDLSRFCANDLDERDYLHTPWRRGQWVYATNGHLAIRVPAAAYPDVAEVTEKVPNLGAMFDKTMTGRDLEYLLLPPVPKLRECYDCDGKGKVRAIKCVDCTDGEFVHGEYLYTCKNCERSPGGEGWEHLPDHCEARTNEVLRTCHTCDGLGFDRRQGCMQLGPAKYSNVYLAMFAALPQVRVCPGTAARDKYDDERELPAIFTFDGGHGMLMPFRE